MRKIVLLVLVCLLAFTLTACKDEIIDTNINIPESGDANIVEKNKESETKKLPKELVESYINIINNSDVSNSNIKYDLIYFNNDDLPDLVVGEMGYFVSLYIYDNGKIYNPIEQWTYGAGGNSGYEYIEKSGVILNNNADFAGAIMTTSNLILNQDYEFDILSATFLGAEISKDDPVYQDVMDAINSYGGYYYNNEKISEEDYNQKLEDYKKDSKILDGDKTASEIINELEKIER